LAEVLTAESAFKEGSPATLNGSATGPFAVAAGSTYTMDVEIVGQVPQEVSVTDSDLDGLLTTAEIVAAIDGLEGVEATDNAGAVGILSSRTGAAISLRVSNGGPNNLAGLIGVPASTTAGSETDVSLTTDLSTLPGNVNDYVVGDQIDVVGVDTDGTSINATFTYGVDGTTVDEFVTFLDGQFTDAQVSLNAAGQLEVAAQTAGDTGLLLTIVDDAGAAGSSDWPTYNLAVSTEGTGPDIVTTSTEIFDSVGMAHALTLNYERQQDLTWTLTASVDDAEGVVQSLPIEGIAFQDDGTPVGLGLIDNSIMLRFAGLSNQRIEVDFGTDGNFDALTQFGSQSTAFVEHQDGFADGKLSSIGVNNDGVIEGFYTNGQSQELGSIGIATFTNPEGLSEVTNNLWVETSNSGAANLSAADSQNGGSVIGGALENSNVDTAEQFVRLIEAQRGFQANARVISTQDEILAEVVNLL
jgi:flagellar hook protein FlgE